MNKGFAKILVAVDGSQPSINAAERAISLAKKYGANASGTVTTSVVHPHGNNHGMIMETENPQKILPISPLLIIQ